jgi:predicted membrane protein
MKMGISFFLGLLFIFIGVQILIKFFFQVSIPLFRILLALVFIYIGVSIFIGRPVFRSFRGMYSENTTIFGSYTNSFQDKEVSSENISIVFGEKTINLNGIKIKGKKASLKLDCAFGYMRVLLDKKIPVRVVGNSAFGTVSLPELNTVVFGTNKYESPGFSTDTPHIEIIASVAFGQISFK